MFESLKLAVRELSRKAHFWILVGLAILGSVLDAYSTFIMVNRYGYGIELNKASVCLWQKLEFLGWPFYFITEQIISLLGWIILGILVFMLVTFILKIFGVSKEKLKFSWKLYIYLVVGGCAVRLLAAFWNYYQFIFRV